MDPLKALEQLRDISGLQAISWWPPAIGWWVIIFCVGCAAIAGLVWLYRRYTFYRSWQGKAYKQLLRLERGLEQDNLKATLQDLSVEIRQIAIYSSTRQDCAALTANNWLQWLQDHDPHGYMWTDNGQALVAGQYAPQESYEMTQVVDMINAIKHWVAKC